MAKTRSRRARARRAPQQASGGERIVSFSGTSGTTVGTGKNQNSTVPFRISATTCGAFKRALAGYKEYRLLTATIELQPLLPNTAGGLSAMTVFNSYDARPTTWDELIIVAKPKKVSAPQKCSMKGSCDTWEAVGADSSAGFTVGFRGLPAETESYLFVFSGTVRVRGAC
jgi:hypothetical protein